MSTPNVSSNAPVSVPPRHVWLREPLLHFVLLGALLFLLDYLTATRADDPYTIVVNAAIDQQARDVFRASRGRDPDGEEMQALQRVWLDNEILYREGLAMQVDTGDESIRERVIFKALSIVDANVKLAPPDDKTLREWFESHRDKYDEPARYDFQEAVIDGDRSESAMRAFVAALNAGAAPDAKAGLRVFTGRPYANIAQSYGDEFPAELARGKPGEWRAIKSKDAWRAVRLGGITPSKPASFDNLAGIVMHDWTDAMASQQRTDAVRALGRKYRIVYTADAS